MPSKERKTEKETVPCMGNLGFAIDLLNQR
jgi:hypothetical protein